MKGVERIDEHASNIAETVDYLIIGDAMIGTAAEAQALAQELERVRRPVALADARDAPEHA
jgi:phosphate uptake regulator